MTFNSIKHAMIVLDRGGLIKPRDEESWEVETDKLQDKLAYRAAYNFLWNNVSFGNSCIFYPDRTFAHYNEKVGHDL